MTNQEEYKTKNNKKSFAFPCVPVGTVGYSFTLTNKDAQIIYALTGSGLFSSIDHLFSTMFYWWKEQPSVWRNYLDYSSEWLKENPFINRKEEKTDISELSNEEYDNLGSKKSVQETNARRGRRK